MILGTDVGKTDSGVLYLHDLFHIDGRHHGKLIEHFGTALNIRAAVKQHEEAVFRRKNRCECGTLDALDSLDKNGCADTQSAAVARAHEGVSSALIEQAETDCHRAVFLCLADAIRLVLHRDNVGTILYLHIIQGNVILLCRLADDILPACQQDVYAEFLDRLSAALDDFERRVVTAEGVYNNCHTIHPYPIVL